jgi:hypothetical protein
MKKIPLLIAIISLFAFTAKAQLVNTKWQGTIKLPMQGGMVDFQTVWNFQKDTLSVEYTGGKLLTDVMTYSEDNKKIVTIRKVSGGVPCDNNDAGKFSYEIKDDQLFLTKIEDACAARGAADVSEPLKKVL